MFDGSIANVALPTIAANLNAPAADSVWVVSAYQLAIVVSLLPTSRFSRPINSARFETKPSRWRTWQGIECEKTKETMSTKAADKSVERRSAVSPSGTYFSPAA
jgi:MFS family permease